MTISLELIVPFVDIGKSIDHHCLEVIVCFVDIGGIIDHHCLEDIVCFVDIGGIVDGQKFYQYQLSKQSSLNGDGQQLHQY
jgi:hypothetical protein